MKGFYVQKKARRIVRSKAALVRAYSALIYGGVFTGSRAAQILHVPQCNIIRWQKSGSSEKSAVKKKGVAR